MSGCTLFGDCSRKSVVCVALVTDTIGLHDHGITQDAWEGLTQLKEARGIDRLEYIESVDARDYEKNIAYFINLHFDIIVTSGIGLRDETRRAADLDEGSYFVGINQPFDRARPNLALINFPEDQMGYLAGAFAAKLSRTHVVGAVCEDSSLDSMWRYCEGFRAGVKATNPKIQALVVYHDNAPSDKLFVDPDWGTQQGENLVAQGADVIFAAGGLTAQAALQAASRAGAMSIGAERDQAAELGISAEQVVTSIYGRARTAVPQVVQSILDNDHSESITGAFGYIPLPDPYPAQLTSEMDELLMKLANGDVKTNVPTSRP